MNPNKTIKEFFEGEKQYTIPVYQRAYSWDEKQWNDFLEDLLEATKGDNHYFFGNVLLEKTDENKTNGIDIIDGQQRITTIIIFARALINALEQKAKNQRLDEEKSNEEFLRYIKEDFLIYRSKPKLQAVEYDRDYFKDVIIQNDNNKHNPQTPSQERIKKAKEFFTKELEKRGSQEILALFKALENAEILSVPFTNKKDSVLMFELQNNRGKDLTNLEKLKSYLAYQIYTYCDKETAETKLREITDIFKEIYRLINAIKNNEDSILNWFNISKFGFEYRENDNEKNYKKEYKRATETKSNEEKIAWIENYVKELKNAFVNFKEFEGSKSVYKDYLLYLNVWEIYPFILKAYRIFKGEQELEQVFKALEIIALRDKLVRTRADLASRLNSVLKNFNSVESLILGLQKICSDEWRYWSDGNFSNGLINIYKENDKKSLPTY
ncbi:DUF262 domain-containing protein [Helicobacter muridarum]|uniref:RloF n=1 Tax=Helicobacter muridarum TaxID=216 RepID=A0A377PUZ7_9HELI|nr:DUF262 domain-containing protein [Helicobacter muridarum]STQ86299.1 RloF [Helicobacter muridarum]